jgi:hypothetical protein
MRNKVARAPVEREAPQLEQPVSSPIETVGNTDIPLVETHRIISFVADEHPDIDFPLPQSYRVIETKSVLYAGSRVTIRKGKVLDERGYDLSTLLEQGVKLEPIEVL